MADQPPLFDNLGVPVPEELALTLGHGPLVRPARVGFLAAMLAVWYADGRVTPAQKERLKDAARDAIQRAQDICG